MTDSPYELPVIIGAHAEGDPEQDDSFGNDVAPPDAEYAKPIFDIPRPDALPVGGMGPWTTISFSYSAQDQAQDEFASSWGMKVGGGVGFGLFSAGGNYAHDQSSQYIPSSLSAIVDLLSLLQEHEVRHGQLRCQYLVVSLVLFLRDSRSPQNSQSLVVNIRRPWLYGELFGDSELDSSAK